MPTAGRGTRSAAAAALALFATSCSVIVSTSGLVGNTAGSDAGLDALGDAATAGNDGSTTDASDAPNAADGAPAYAYAKQVLADSPVAYFPLDEASGAVAKNAMGGKNATYDGKFTFGAASAVTGSRAIVLDGSTSRIDLGDVFPFGGLTSFSIEVWLKPSVVDGQVRWIFDRNVGTGPSEGYDAYFSDTFLLFARSTNDAEFGWVTMSRGPDNNSWSHIVTTLDSVAGVITLYVNGAQVASGAANGTIGQGAGSLVFGDRARPQFYKFVGAMDEIAVYDKPLSAARVTAHYAAR